MLFGVLFDLIQKGKTLQTTTSLSLGCCCRTNRRTSERQRRCNKTKSPATTASCMSTNTHREQPHDDLRNPATQTSQDQSTTATTTNNVHRLIDCNQLSTVHTWPPRLAALCFVVVWLCFVPVFAFATFAAASFFKQNIVCCD